MKTNKELNIAILNKYCPRQLSPEEIGEIAFYLKNTHGITQREIAEHIGISQKTLIKYIDLHKKTNTEEK